MSKKLIFTLHSMGKRKIIFIHTAIWLSWLTANNLWTLFAGVKQPIIPVVYNNLSLVIIFYLAYWIAAKNWRYIEKSLGTWVDEGGDMTERLPFSWAHYVFRWPLFAMIAAVLLFIYAAWTAEGIFVQMGYLPFRLKNLPYFIHSRWNIEAFYVCGGNILAALQFQIRMQAKKYADADRFCKEKASEALFYKNRVMKLLERMQKRRDEREREDDAEG
jgi:hypothetical protein